MGFVTASDYAALTAGGLIFYYGYEETHCPEHGRDRSICAESETCDPDWCFVAERSYRRGRVELFRYTETELDLGDRFDCVTGMMRGLEKLLDKGLLVLTRT